MSPLSDPQAERLVVRVAMDDAGLAVELQTYLEGLLAAQDRHPPSGDVTSPSPVDEAIERIVAKLDWCEVEYFVPTRLDVEDLRLIIAETEIKSLRSKLDLAVKALEPFAEFVSPSATFLKDDHAITQGSPMARNQLTVGQCRLARSTLTEMRKT